MKEESVGLWRISVWLSNDLRPLCYLLYCILLFISHCAFPKSRYDLTWFSQSKVKVFLFLYKRSNCYTVQISRSIKLIVKLSLVTNHDMILLNTWFICWLKKAFGVSFHNSKASRKWRQQWLPIIARLLTSDLNLRRSLNSIESKLKTWMR